MIGTVRSMPRLVTSSLLLATGSSLWAALSGLGRALWISPIDWAVLSVSTLVLCAVAVERPEFFRVRDFRLAGVMTASMALMLLVPLPWLVRRYGDQVPRLVVLSIAAGVLAMACVFLVAPRVRSVVRPPDNDRELGLPFGLLFVAIAIFPLWIRSLGSLPISGLLSGGSSGVDLAIARFEALRGLQSLPLRVTVGAMRNLYLMFVVGWFAAWWVTTSKANWRIRNNRLAWLSGALGLAVIFSLVTTERAIVGQVIVAAIIAVLAATGKRLGGKVFAALVGATVAFPLVFGFLVVSSSGGSPISGAYESVRRRIFYLPGDVMMQYFASFPERMPFLQGASLPKIQRLFGGSTFDLSGYIYQVAYQFDSRVTGNANGTFLGVGWANFGWTGVVLWSVVVAVTLVMFEHALRHLPRRTAAALRGVACIQAVLLTSADITRTLLNFAPGLLDLLVVALAMAWLERRRAGNVGSLVSSDRAGGGRRQQLASVHYR